MTAVSDLERGRTAFEDSDWTEAYGRLSAADRAEPLGPEDLEALATTAHLTGRTDVCVDVWTRGHQEYLKRGDNERAAGCAYWLAFTLVNRGEFALANGWVGRGVALLDAGAGECVQRGFLLLLTGIQALMQGEAERALATIAQAHDVADRFHDPDLTVLTLLAHGQTLIELGETDEGIELMDQAMVAVTADDVSAPVAGLVYCAVISACQDLFDLRRAQQWTTALTHWCDAQPGLVPYTGQCLVHRAEIMQLHGAWPDATEAAQAACERFELAADPVSAGAAHYVTGEVERLRGNHDLAERAYREASRRGHDPQPGVALLRLAQGRPDVAATTIRRVVGETADPLRRPRLLAAQVDIMLAVDDVTAARAAADELAGIARDHGSPMLRAIAARRSGAVLLSEAEPRAALAELRTAWTGWQDLGVPHEAARARELIGLACRAVGDEDTALMELDAARWAFEQLGAEPDLTRVDALARPPEPDPAGGLTAREAEVLGLVATGATNRAIAADLVLSDKTVARHISNIFTKIGVSSRAAATAYAYEHDLV